MVGYMGMDFRRKDWAGTQHWRDVDIHIINVSRDERFPGKKDFPCSKQEHFKQTKRADHPTHKQMC